MTLAETIRTMLAKSGTPMTPANVSEALGIIDSKKRITISASLREMHVAGSVTRHGDTKPFRYSCSDLIVSRLNRGVTGFDDTALSQLMAKWPKRRKSPGVKGRVAGG